MSEPKQLRVVAIGGGTGLSTLLRGLKRFVAAPSGSPTPATANCKDLPCLIRELSAIVTVTDDGGSSGRLREELNILPPGDVRNCMVALSEDEHLLSQPLPAPLLARRSRRPQLRQSLPRRPHRGHLAATSPKPSRPALKFSPPAAASILRPSVDATLLRARWTTARSYSGETRISASHRSKHRPTDASLPADAGPLSPKHLTPSPPRTSSPLAPARSIPRSSPTCWCAAFRKRSPRRAPPGFTFAT